MKQFKYSTGNQYKLVKSDMDLNEEFILKLWVPLEKVLTPVNKGLAEIFDCFGCLVNKLRSGLLT